MNFPTENRDGEMLSSKRESREEKSDRGGLDGDSEHLRLAWGKGASISLAAQEQTSGSLTPQRREQSQIY